LSVPARHICTGGADFIFGAVRLRGRRRTISAIDIASARSIRSTPARDGCPIAFAFPHSAVAGCSSRLQNALSWPRMTIDPLMLLQAYAIGVFPMSDDRDADEIYWVEPKRRAILPLDGFCLSRSLAKTIRRDRFRVTANRNFPAILALCAEAAPDRPSTWISRDIEAAYIELHRLGFAHSIECWEGEELVGGLYGVSLGQAFFGESMVSRRADASKVALAWLVARMRSGGFSLLDCQFMTDHLRSLGAIEIGQAEYLGLLGQSVAGVPLGAGRGLLSVGPGAATSLAFDALAAGAEADPALSPLPPIDRVSGPVSGQDIAQLLTQTS
jgi:leucyl/phenylalanyl-tRNA--protein transferase